MSSGDDRVGAGRPPRTRHAHGTTRARDTGREVRANDGEARSMASRARSEVTSRQGGNFSKPRSAFAVAKCSTGKFDGGRKWRTVSARLGKGIAGASDRAGERGHAQGYGAWPLIRYAPLWYGTVGPDVNQWAWQRLSIVHCKGRHADRIHAGDEIALVAVDLVLAEAPDLNIDLLLKTTALCRQQQSWVNPHALAACIRRRLGLGPGLGLGLGTP